jgi:uncharacterized integral membrane protein
MAMIRKIVTVVVLVPLVILFLGFAVANRQIVLLSFDPFNATSPDYSTSLPLFALVLLLLIIGVLIGGAAAWLGQGKWRRAARHLDAENRALHAEVLELRRQADASARVAIPPPETVDLRSPV